MRKGIYLYDLKDLHLPVWNNYFTSFCASNVNMFDYDYSSMSSISLLIKCSKIHFLTSAFIKYKNILNCGTLKMEIFRALTLSRVCTFSLKFFSGHLKKLQNIIICWKKYISYHFDYFPGCSAPFWLLRSLKMRKCPYLSNRWSYEVLRPSFSREHACLYTCFIQIVPLKWTEVLQNRKNGENKLNAAKFVQIFNLTSKYS